MSKILMIIISLRKLDIPARGIVKDTGWMDPSGNLYPVNDLHCMWILDHRDWLVEKGFDMPSTMEIRKLILDEKYTKVTDPLLKQGWTRIHTADKIIVYGFDNIQKVEDAILTRKIIPMYPLYIYDALKDRNTVVDSEQDLKTRGIVVPLTFFSRHADLFKRLKEMNPINVQGFENYTPKIRSQLKKWFIDRKIESFPILDFAGDIVWTENEKDSDESITNIKDWHRPNNLPAIEFKGERPGEYYVHGKRHREDGPALYDMSRYRYYLDNKQYSKEEFDEIPMEQRISVRPK